MRRIIQFAFALCLFAIASAPARAANDARVRFEVTLGDNLASGPVSGRLLVFMTPNTAPLMFVSPTLPDINSVWICAQEITTFFPGQTIEIDPDATAFPGPFSSAPPGNYQVMALLDTNHTYAYWGVGPGDIVSPVVPLRNFQPDGAGRIPLQLTARVPDISVPETDDMRIAALRSDLLSAFEGRPVEMRAGVYLPPSYARSPTRRYPTVYYIHGFGGSYADMWRAGPGFSGPIPAQMRQGMAATNWPEMIYVFLDATCPLGHHEFADSVNDGPWGSALIQEFIPYLEQNFRMQASPAGRLLTGHSSGGWSSLWLQVSHPDFFGGVWATSPDPVDFRNWTGPNLTRLPTENVYFKSDGTPRWLMRIGNTDTVKFQDFARQEMVLGDYGGQLASFEAVFSPRGGDGRPMKLFNRDTGAIDPFVQQAWQKYDISRILKDNWPELSPKLKGKLHIIVGTQDTIWLNEPVSLLRDVLKKLGSDAKITFLEGRDHFNVYNDDLARTMAWEMYSTAHPDGKTSE